MMKTHVAALLPLLFLLAAHASPAQESASDERETAEDELTLDEVTVLGRAQTLYQTDSATTATRTPTPLEDVPQSVQVLPRELIDDQAARQIIDLYRNISGVSYFSYAGVTFRGFRQDEILYDGLRGDPFIGFAVPQLFTIDRIEVLKGPSGALYGAGEPGGIINYVTKKPEPVPLARFTGRAGDDSLRGASAELGGPIAGETVSYRLGAFYEEEDPFRFNTDARNEIYDGGLAFNLGNRGEAIVQAFRYDQHLAGARLRGVPVNDAGEFLTDIRWNHNEPTDFQSLESEVLQGSLDYGFDGGVSIDASARYIDSTEMQNYHESLGLVDSNSDGVNDFMTREFRDQLRDTQTLSGTANLLLEREIAGLGHTLLLGADWLETDAAAVFRTAQQEQIGGPVPGLSLFDPAYGLTGAADYDLAGIEPRFTDAVGVRRGIYLQDQIAIAERWQALAGLRYNDFTDHDRITGLGFEDQDLTYRAGLVFEVASPVSLYANHATGFAPQGIGDQSPFAGGPFEPETSRQWELGAKTRLAGGRFELDTALYRIERRNVLQADPRGDVGGDGLDDLMALGRVRSRGVELNFLGDLTERWVMLANYAYNDARVLESTDGITNSIGDRFVNAPRHQFGLWTRYDLPAIDSAMAFGADYLSERMSFDGQRVKPYAVFDASWHTRFGAWVVQVNVKNLFDKEYAASGFSERNGHFPGEPRRVFLELQYRL